MPRRRNRIESFASFVCSDENQFALAATRAVAGRPGRYFNPLLMYGAPASGKTHLLHAAAREIAASRARPYVVLTSGESLAHAFVAARVGRRLGALRDGLAAADAVLVDAVDGLIPFGPAAHAFAALVKRLHRRRVQMILTSRLPPERLGPIHGAVQSLEWAMTVRIGLRPRSRPNPRRSAT